MTGENVHSTEHSICSVTSRERCFKQLPGEVFNDRFLNFADFRGSHVIVHNNIMKRIFVETKYIESQHIFVVGPPRMDRYLKDRRWVTEAKKTEFVYFRFRAGLLGSSPSLAKRSKHLTGEIFY